MTEKPADTVIAFTSPDGNKVKVTVPQSIVDDLADKGISVEDEVASALIKFSKED